MHSSLGYQRATWFEFSRQSWCCAVSFCWLASPRKMTATTGVVGVGKPWPSSNDQTEPKPSNRITRVSPSTSFSGTSSPSSSTLSTCLPASTSDPSLEDETNRHCVRAPLTMPKTTKRCVNWLIFNVTALCTQESVHYPLQLVKLHLWELKRNIYGIIAASERNSKKVVCRHGRIGL